MEYSLTRLMQTLFPVDKLVRQWCERCVCVCVCVYVGVWVCGQVATDASFFVAFLSSFYASSYVYVISVVMVT